MDFNIKHNYKIPIECQMHEKLYTTHCPKFQSSEICIPSSESRSGMMIAQEFDCVSYPKDTCDKNLRRCEPLSWIQGQCLNNYVSC